MAEMECFRLGNLVQHEGMGAGTVIGVGETVDVRYHHVNCRGKHSTGIYDAAWFRLHPMALLPSPPKE